MAVTAAVVGAVAAVGGTVHAVESSAQQRRLAGQAGDRQKRDQEVAIQEAEKQKDREERAAAEIALRDQGRQTAAASMKNNKSGTLLTGAGNGLGQPAASNGGAKTLLGY